MFLLAIKILFSNLIFRFYISFWNIIFIVIVIHFIKIICSIFIIISNTLSVISNDFSIYDESSNKHEYL